MVEVLEKSRIMIRFACVMNIKELTDKELRELFEERKNALLEVRDEIDRREKKPSARVEFTDYIGDGIEN